jgi:uncharacterized protein YecE (DUF72 family)
MAGRIHVGIGGWTFEPWRKRFYPAGLPHARELEYASRRLSAIEINGTFYGTQKRSSFARWRDETPEGFVFAVKASRHATHRRVLAEAGESIERFVGSGIAELGPKLGPLLWQLPATKRFDADEVDAFLSMLPRQAEGVPLRHAVDVRHDSFRCAPWLAIARRRQVASVFTDSDDYPSFADPTADFVYLREMRTRADLPSGVEPAALDAMAAGIRRWAEGDEPLGVPRVEPAQAPATTTTRRGRDVFCFFIAGAKERAPAAALGLLERLR